MGDVITANGVKRGFIVGSNTFWALSDINLTIPQGKLTILKGRSGSGKTTLMNILGALDYPTEGEIYFNDKNICKMNDKQRDIIRSRDVGFIFQSVALVSIMTAYENIEFSMRISKTPRSEWNKNITDALALVGLAGRMSHYPPEMSGGEQQRVAIARALAHKPKVIFADEPTAELDTNTGLIIVKLFKELVEKENCTIVMTTHDPSIMDVCDKLYELQDGRIIDERVL